MTCLRSTSASSRSTFQVKKTTGFYPRPSVDANGKSAVGQAGGVLLTSTVRAAGLDVGLSAVLGPWRPVGATHDPAKVLLDLAITLALGGDICSDLAVVRAEPAIFGRVASDPTASRTIARLAADVDKVLPAIDRARAAAQTRERAAARARSIAGRTLSTSAARRAIVRDAVGSEATRPKMAGSARTTARSEQVSPPRARVIARSSSTLAGSWVAPTGRHGPNTADSPTSRPAARTVEVSSTPPA